MESSRTQKLSRCQTLSDWYARSLKMYLLGLMEIAKDVLEAGLLDWTLMLVRSLVLASVSPFLLLFNMSLPHEYPPER